MKRLFLAFAAASIMLTGCASTTGTANTAQNQTIGTATAIGTNIFKAAVDSQCRTSLQGNTAFRTVALAMTPEQQQAVEDKVCSCVSEKAPQNVTVVELTQAAIDPNARAQIVANAVTKTMTACYSEFVNKR